MSASFKHLPLLPAVLLLLAAFLMQASGAVAAKPDEVLETAENAVKTEQAAQKMAEEWAEEKEDLLRRSRDLKTRLAWLEFQVDKYAAYVDTQQETLAELERRKAELETVRQELEPFLADLVDRLETFVQNDLPFLPDERAKRIAFLRESLADYHLSLSEKLRRVLEALQVEADYGKSVERSEKVIDLDGQPTRVDLLRLGRLALFYVTPDVKRMGRWDPAAGQWVELDQTFRRQLRNALEMADRRRVVELLRLPVASKGGAQ